MTADTAQDRAHGTDPGAVLFITMMASFTTPFVLSAINVALPAMAADLQLTARTMPWVSLSFLAASSVLLIPMGKFADIHGRKRLFRAGFIVFTAASALCAAAGSAAALVAARALQGVGSSMIFGTAIAILTSVFPPERRGRAIGLNVASTYTGLCAGPVLGGFLCASLGWRSIFLVNTAVGLAVLWQVARHMKGEWRGAEGDTFDLKGALLYAGSMALLLGGTTAVTRPAGAAAALAGLCGLAWFARFETKAGYPVLDVGLMVRTPRLLFSNLAALINYSSTFSISFLLSLYLQYARGMGPRQAGLTLLWMPAMMAVFSPYAGRVSDSRDPGVIASAGMAVCAAGVLLFAFVGPATPLPLIWAGLAVSGLGMALFSAPNTSAVMGAVTPRHYSMASSTLATMRVLGQMTSMSMAAVIFAVHLGKQKLSPELAGELIQSIRAAMLLSAALCVAGVFASLKRGKAEPAQVQNSA